MGRQMEAAALLEGMQPSARCGMSGAPGRRAGKDPAAAADGRSGSVLPPARQSPVGGASACASKRAEGFVLGFFIFVNCMSDEAADSQMM